MLKYFNKIQIFALFLIFVSFSLFLSRLLGKVRPDRVGAMILW
jgi:hypothetical protein